MVWCAVSGFNFFRSKIKQIWLCVSSERLCRETEATCVHVNIDSVCVCVYERTIHFLHLVRAPSVSPTQSSCSSSLGLSWLCWTMWMCRNVFWEAFNIWISKRLLSQVGVCVVVLVLKAADVCACVCLCAPVGADCSVWCSSRSAGSLLPLLLLLGRLPGLRRMTAARLNRWILVNERRLMSKRRKGWLMAKWPSRWTSTAPTPRRPSRTTTSTRAASNLHTSTCKCLLLHWHTPATSCWSVRLELLRTHTLRFFIYLINILLMFQW